MNAIIVVLSFALVAWSAETPKILSCARIVNGPAQYQAMDDGLPPKSTKAKGLPRDTKYLIGVLAYIGQDLHLIVGSYYGGHSDLFVYAQSLGHITRLVWSGELQIQRGTILAANATSSMFQEYSGDRSATPLLDFSTVLKAYRPELLSPRFRTIEYSDAEAHLSAENYSGRFRHDFRNLLNVLMGRILLAQRTGELHLSEVLLRVAKGILETTPFLQGKLHIDLEGLAILSNWVELSVGQQRPLEEVLRLKDWLVLVSEKLKEFDVQQSGLTRDIVLATGLN